MSGSPTVYIVDDDPNMCDSLCRLVQSGGWTAIAYESAQEFLKHYDPARPGCLLLDLYMPGMDGLALQHEMQARGVRVPTIVISGRADVQSIVRSVRAGALDVLEKPISKDLLFKRIRQALQQDEQSRQEHAQRMEWSERLALLTPREREVMELLVTGRTTKETAATLGVRPKTIDVHRARILAKMQVDTLPALVHLVLTHFPEKFPAEGMAQQRQTLGD